MMKCGYMIKNSHTDEIGIVIKIIGKESDPHAIIVKVGDKHRKWILKHEEKVSFMTRIKSWFAG